MRAHIEVDPIVELMGMDAMLALKREYAPAVDLQLCAFAQEGTLQAPPTEALLRRALEMGADLVAGCRTTTPTRGGTSRSSSRSRTSSESPPTSTSTSATSPSTLHVREIVRQTVQTGWAGGGG